MTSVIEDETRFLTEKNHRPSSIANFGDIEESKEATKENKKEVDDDLLAF